MSDASGSAPAPSPGPPPSRGVRTDQEVQRGLRRIGLGLIVAAVAVDVVWSEIERQSARYRALQFQLTRRVDPPGPIILAAGISLLEATSEKRG